MAISKKLLNPGERLVLSTRQHPKALFGPILALVVLLAIGVAAQVLLDDTGFQRVLTLIVWVLVIIGILWFSVRPFLDWLTTVHAFTDRRLITRNGIITRRGHDIPLARVSDIAMEINLLDRPFGCGSLLISDASTFGTVRLNDIPHVEATQRQLNELLHELHSGPAPRRDEGV
ncbi:MULTISPECIES: PH domain-containing protein [unclassified Nocardioides]|uniref:PH domain-containing protein n=1 Tax=unclassified Nocardioides TaxID=2615069 RepID=UPI00114DECFF|nr:MULTISPECIES: PH domain-containing protein [unclassified Nocardioides]TQK72355.1 PH (Pleckstrin Homology) domain-containing protein [Nocardioides sp. SLBN-35]WGY03437.1 PH domain-containing protein [Nocardioides sp. QY071]